MLLHKLTLLSSYHIFKMLIITYLVLCLLIFCLIDDTDGRKSGLFQYKFNHLFSLIKN